MFLFISYVYQHLGICVNVGIHRGHGRMLDPLELGLQMVVSFSTWVVGTELMSSGRTSALS